MYYLEIDFNLDTNL